MGGGGGGQRNVTMTFLVINIDVWRPPKEILVRVNNKIANVCVDQRTNKLVSYAPCSYLSMFGAGNILAAIS